MIRGDSPMSLQTLLRAALAGLVLASFTFSAQAETIRIAIGTQDTTINCAAGGLLIRELGLLDKYLPHDGQYKDANYEVEWKNFIVGVFVLAIVGQVFIQQAKLADQQTASGAIDRGVLGADGNADGFRLRGEGE